MWSSTVACLVTFTLSLVMAPLAITAQPREKIPRVAVLEPGSHARPTPCLLPFQQGLRDLGYVEGQTILLDYRYSEGHIDRLPALAAELVQHVRNRLGFDLQGYHCGEGKAHGARLHLDAR